MSLSGQTSLKLMTALVLAGVIAALVILVISGRGAGSTIGGHGPGLAEEPTRASGEAAAVADGAVETTPFDEPGARRPVQGKPGKGLLVRVLWREGRAPCAGARLTLVRMQASRAVPPDDFVQDAHLTMLEQLGQAFVCDEQGEAMLEGFQGKGVLVTRHAGYTLIRDLDASSEEPIEILLPPDELFRIQVVDKQGRPRAGIPLAVFPVGDQEQQAVARLTTHGEQGMAFLDAEALRRAARLLPSVESRDPVQLEIEPAFPSRERHLVRFEVGKRQESPLVLVLPHHGRVEVLVIDGQGRPLPGRQRVILELPENDVWQRASQETEMARTKRLEQGTRNGRTVFPLVGVGLRFAVRVVSSSGQVCARERVFGPSRDGETVRCEIQAGELLTIKGVLVDEHGERVSNERVAIRLEDSDAQDPVTFFTLGDQRTDAEGRFTHAVRRTDSAARRRLSVFSLSAHAGAGGSAVRVLPEVIDGSEWDAGTMRLVRPESLVMGRVLDMSGRPVASAKVEASFKPKRDGAPTNLRTFLSRDQWVGTACAATDEHGRFRLPGAVDGGQYLLKLSAGKPGYCFEEPVVVEAGSREIELRLRPAGALKGRIVVDDAFAPFNADGGPVKATVEREGRPDIPVPINAADGSFRVLSLPPGRCSFVLRARDDGAVVHRVDGLVAVAGRQITDSRLQSIDLRGRLRLLTVTAHVGQPEVDVWLQAKPSAGLRWRWRGSSRTSDPLVWKLVTAKAPVDLHIAESSKTQRRLLTGVSEDVEITLDPALAVELVLDAAVPLPPPRYHLRVRLHPRGDGQVPEASSGNMLWVPSFGALRHVTLPVSMDTEYELRAALMEPSAPWRIVDLEAVTPKVIRISGRDPKRRFVIRIGPRELARAQLLIDR